MKILKGLFLVLIRVYQRILSPILFSLGVQCRFQPTCSHYMFGAIEAYGPLVGLAKGIHRLCRCHPFCEGGLDPVIKEHGHI